MREGIQSSAQDEQNTGQTEGGLDELSFRQTAGQSIFLNVAVLLFRNVASLVSE